MPNPIDDLVIEIAILANSKQSVEEVKRLEAELVRLREHGALTKQSLKTLFDSGTISAKTFEQATKRVNQALRETPQQLKKATDGLFSLRNVARTALGTFEAMAIFFATQFVGRTISKVIDSLKQLELSFYRLGIAERAISQAGVDINPQQLTAIAKQVTDTYATVSQIDALKMISNLAVLTKDLQLTADQYNKIAMAIPLIAQQSDVSIESATDQIIQGLTKSGRGWADLGITVDSAIIKQEAISMGLVANAKAYNELTAEQKQHVEVLALINILNENANENLASQADYLETIAGKQGKANQLWETFTTNLGVLLSPALQSGFSLIIKFLEELVRELEVAKTVYIEFMGVFVGGGQAIQQVLQGNIKSVSDFVKVFEQANALAKQNISDYLAPDLPEDTPTNINPTVETELEDDDLQKALEKMNTEILEAQIRLAQDMEDAQIDLGRKLVDITTEYARKRADAEKEYGDKVRDINASYRDKIADINSEQQEANQDARNDELERETEFQNKMLELRERFLMDLEEALHARDARQVLRLMKQYELDKTQAQRDKELEDNNAMRDQRSRQQRFARERADAERSRRAKLADAQREYQDKLIKLKADEEAERQAAELAYQRKIQDLEREMQNRLEILGANLIAEFNLTNTGLNAILTLYQKYYKNIAQIYMAMNKMLQGSQNIASTLTTPTRVNPTLSPNSGQPTTIGGHQRYKDGGTLITDQPTQVTMGEGGIEMGQFTPLSKTGKNINRLFSNLSGDGKSDGKIALEVSLSPDLEVRITENTLNQTADIIEQIDRRKR